MNRRARRSDSSKKPRRGERASKRNAHAKRIVRVNANLFNTDIEAVRVRAKANSVPTSIELRQLVHEALNPLKAYKFFVRPDENVTIPLGEIDPVTGACPAGVHQLSDVGACCVAHSQEEALQVLEAYAVRDGLDSRWLRKAPHAVEIDFKTTPTFIMWAVH